ncbi:MAG: hypothetical protein Q8P07_01475 [bacterium]|nr:hypothetical protein [bacterium]
MKNPEILLKDILKLRKDFQSQAINLPPGLAGMYGEILAYQKLEQLFGKRGYSVKYFSGQKGADIQLVKGKTLINIEVKTSRLKDEGFGLWYGAALNLKSCKKPEHNKLFYLHPKKGKIYGDFCYFDYLIFVALNNAFKAKFYIIPRNFIEQNKRLLVNKHARFSSSTHRVLISNGKMPTLPDIRIQKNLILQTEKFQNCWDIIKIK